MSSVHRRRFLADAALSVAATQFGLSAFAETKSKTLSRTASISLKEQRTKNSFDTIKQVDAGVLNIGYAEEGPAAGPPVILIHGWPYDIHSFEEVSPILAKKGYRVLMPYLRGYGSTHFLSEASFRNGQQSAIASDIIAFMDALKIQKALVAGFDWGARTAVILGALWPERCKAIVAVSGYIVTNLKANQQPLPPKAEYGWWYQYYFATERGMQGYSDYRNDFNKLIWQIASPKWKFDEATFNRTAAAFTNPDHVAIVIHNYRWRLGLAPGESKYDVLENKLATSPAVTVPAITISSDFDGAAADGKSYASKFTGKYNHKILKDIGHNVPQEAPEEFARAIVEADGF
jgi:pimeloyl-ACP methyl ester carboxylesterase